MNELLRVRAQLRLLTEAEGGKRTPIASGYRPNHNFAGPENRSMCVGQIDLMYRERLNPGETAVVSITFQPSSALPKSLQPGRSWRVQEGARLVGIATIE